MQVETTCSSQKCVKRFLSESFLSTSHAEPVACVGVQAGVQYGSHLHLRSSPYSISELQRLPPHHRREGGPSLMSPRHFSAPNLSQGSMDLYQQRSHLPSDNPALASSAFGQQGGLEARGTFGVEASGSYGQPGLQARASYGQQSSPRSLQFARSVLTRAPATFRV